MCRIELNQIISCIITRNNLTFHKTFQCLLTPPTSPDDHHYRTKRQTSILRLKQKVFLSRSSQRVHKEMQSLQMLSNSDSNLIVNISDGMTAIYYISNGCIKHSHTRMARYTYLNKLSMRLILLNKMLILSNVLRYATQHLKDRATIRNHFHQSIRHLLHFTEIQILLACCNS